MNRNPNNDRRSKHISPPSRPMQGNPARPGSANTTQRRQTRPIDAQNHVRRPNSPSDPRANRRSVQKKRSGMAKVAAVWISFLAILLTVILIIAYASDRGENKDNESLPAVANTETTVPELITTENTAVPDYAVTDEDTSGFSSALDMEKGILIDLESNTVVASRGGDDRIYPASMTKIMTLIVAAEHCKDLDETFTMTAEITDPLYLANASVAGFAVGEKVTVRDLIYGLILPSGGDGAMGLALHIAGSEAAFADLMNDKVKELGLKNTHFTNPTGLHDVNNYSTCHEIGLILEYAIRNDFMREVLTTYQYTTESTPEHPEGILLTSTLLSRMNGDESKTMFVQGGKTGFTNEAKNCLATFATPLVPGMTEAEMKKNPTKYILVTAGSENKFGPVFTAIEVYKKFGAASVDGTAAESADTNATDPGETKNTESVSTSEKDSVKIYTAADPD